MQSKPILVISMVFLLFSCNKKVETKVLTPRVEVGTVKQETIPIGLKAIGHCTANKSANIQAQVEGRLRTIHYNEGSFVNEGELLITIDPDPYVADLEKNIAIRAENFAKLKYSAEVVYRYKGLLKEDYVSRLEYDGFVRDLAEYEATVMQNDASIRLSQINLDYCFIRAPFSGIVGKKLVDEGNLITNDGSTMVVINQVDPIFIDFSLPEKDFKMIMKYRKGNANLEVDIKIPDEEPYKANLILVDNTIDPNTGMVPLRAQTCNENNNFWPGQYVEANLILTYEENALLIPSKAITTGSKGAFVYVIEDDNHARYVPVKAFNIYGQYTHVKANLKKGDRIITRGQINVRPNNKVEVVKTGESQ
ncbi:MAG: Multidrug resistance protein MdtA [Chlamydiia bacterium]|nr:Multidrug resistance protein MdtA [Chlamydiia bacterium]